RPESSISSVSISSGMVGAWMIATSIGSSFERRPTARSIVRRSTSLPPGARPEHRRQERLDLRGARAGEKGNAVRPRRLPGRPDAGPLRHLVDQGVADMDDVDPGPGVEVELEGEEDEHPVDHPGDALDPAAPPGPDLRADVVED